MRKMYDRSSQDLSLGNNRLLEAFCQLLLLTVFKSIASSFFKRILALTKLI